MPGDRLVGCAHEARDNAMKRGFYHLVAPILAIRADAETRILLEEAERRAPTESRVQMMLAMLEIHEGRVDKALARSKGTPRNEFGIRLARGVEWSTLD